MRNKTFKCPYLTAEDKEFLKYEQKIYKENFKELLQFYNKHEALLKRTDNEAENDDSAQHSSLCYETGSNIFFTLTMVHVLFIEDICRYFYKTHGVTDLVMGFTSDEIAEPTKLLELDEVFDKYVRGYLEGKNN